MASTVPSIPPAATPVVDSLGNFQKTWFLFLTALTQYLASTSSGALAGYYEVPIILAGGVYSATPDLSQGLDQEVDLVNPQTLIVTPANATPGDTWSLAVVQDSTGGRQITFDSGYAGAAAIVGMLFTLAETYCSLTFVVRPDGTSALKAITTGLPVT